MRFAIRQLLGARGFTAITIATLAVAIGANTAVFTVLNSVLLRPLPYPEPEDLAVVWSRYLPESGYEIDKFPVSDPEWLDYQEGTEAFESLGALRAGTSTLTGDGEEAERISVAFVSAGVLPTLRIPAEHGRWFTPDEDVAEGPDVVVLSHDLWRTRFGADAAVVGSTILMNGVPQEVVGVMPSGFDFPGGVEAWLPLQVDRTSQSNRGGHGLSLIGRLAPARSMEDVGAEFGVFKTRWADEYEHNRGHFLWSQTLETEVVADAPGKLRLLMAAVGLVLFVACANVASLMLTRAERRQWEVALRAALGATRGRITRQLATESALLAGAAAALGLGLAVAGVRFITRTYPTALPRFGQVEVDPVVLAFTLGVTVLTVLLFGVGPAYLAGRRATASSALGAGRWTGDRRAAGLRRILVAMEVAVSLVVVVLAGLLVRTSAALASTDPRLDAENLLTFSITLPWSSYPDPALVPAELERLRGTLLALPGVTDVAAASALPFSASRSNWDFQLDDRPPRQEGDMAWGAGVTFVTPDYFETMGIPVLEGRALERGDGPDAPLVALVSQTMATRYWPGESAVGKRFGYMVEPDSIPWMTVVGVVPDPVNGRVDEEPYPYVYVPEAQAIVSANAVPRSLGFAVRAGLDPTALTPAVRRAVADFDLDLAMYEVRTMESMIAGSVSDTTITADLLGTFALIAMALAAVGIYGTISYSVAGRTREIGVRVALGAERGSVARMMLATARRNQVRRRLLVTAALLAAACGSDPMSPQVDGPTFARIGGTADHNGDGLVCSKTVRNDSQSATVDNVSGTKECPPSFRITKILTPIPDYREFDDNRDGWVCTMRVPAGVVVVDNNAQGHDDKSELFCTPPFDPTPAKGPKPPKGEPE